MKKLILILIGAIIGISLLTGCTSGKVITIGSVQNDTASSMSMSYYEFNGEKTAKVTVKKGETVDVKVNIETKKGSIGLTITNESGKAFYKGTDIPTSSFAVKLDEEGDYTLKVNAKNHRGSYKIAWGK